MFFSASTLAATAALLSAASAVSAQSVPNAASPLQLAEVSAEYANSGLNDTGNAGFGISLDAKALLNVFLANGEEIQNGQSYSVDAVNSMPSISVTPSNSTASWFNQSAEYTLVLADASSLGDPDPQGNYRHYLANSLTGTAGSGENLTFVPEGGNTVTSFAAPGPIAGTGPHRYAWLMFVQPNNFTAPQNLSSNAGPGHWYVQSYVQSTGLELVAASFFTVENGQPTGSVASTQAVNTATLVVSTSTGGSNAAQSTGASGSKTGSQSNPSSTGSPSSGASKSVAVSVGAGLVGLVGFVALC
ncbi:hypothetical protein JCM8202_000196 [Rhodotorula sphaerocarpa]